MSISLFGLLKIPVPCELDSSVGKHGKLLIDSFVDLDYPIAMVILDLILGGPPKGIAGLVGMIAGHTW